MSIIYKIKRNLLVIKLRGESTPEGIPGSAVWGNKPLAEKVSNQSFWAGLGFSPGNNVPNGL